MEIFYNEESLIFCNFQLSGDVFRGVPECQLRTKAASYLRFSGRKGVLRNFAKFTGKHLYQSLFFNTVVGLRPLTLKWPWHSCFPLDFVKILRTAFYRTPPDDCFCKENVCSLGDALYFQNIIAVRKIF